MTFCPPTTRLISVESSSCAARAAVAARSNTATTAALAEGAEDVDVVARTQHPGHRARHVDGEGERALAALHRRRQTTRRGRLLQLEVAPQQRLPLLHLLGDGAADDLVLLAHADG